MRFSSTWSISPAAYFGLPDAATVVVSAAEGPVSVYSAPIHAKSGRKVGHGTLSQFRKEEDALRLELAEDPLFVQVRDNIFFVQGEFDSAQAAHEAARIWIGDLCRGLGAQLGTRFQAEFLLIENENGDPHRVLIPETSQILKATFYNLPDLAEKIATAAKWSSALTEITSRSLLYYEHAQLQKEFAESLDSEVTIIGMAQALAFLQLYKAISLLIGDPGTDRDYQRRAKSIGLAKDYWKTEVKPLYTVRCDADVAHYALETPPDDQFRDHFAQAVRVFATVLNATINQRT